MFPKYPENFLEKNLNNCKNKDFCEGGCSFHTGNLNVVRVIDASSLLEWDWGYYTYCETAIKEDKRRGFVVLTEGDKGFLPEND